MSLFYFAGSKGAASLYYDKKSQDAKGFAMMAETFSEDVKAVTGQTIQTTDKPQAGDIVMGTIGSCDVLDEKIKEGKLSVSEVEGKREVFSFALADGIFFIIGSERIATIFGLFELSRRFGVSPWVYWADVNPAKKAELAWEESEISFVSKEPSVRYRGFFMNDEWPCLGNFVMNQFGDFNAAFYRKVFELLLRMKGNYFWPCMWSASFPLDGGNGNPLGNMELSDALGITACFSHHEPMTRASEEWDKVKSKKNGEGYGADWNYYTNEKGLHKYWEDGLERDKELRNMITIGMRGERDTSMLGPKATVKENVDLLRKIISDQQSIIKDKNCEDMPQMLALYKEVEEYYYGSENAEGLCKWDALNPVTLLLSDDNFGNVRTLPTKENRDRKAGWGLYYHFDYHGAPISYEWVSSMPLPKTWEQVSMAYDYGIRDLWVVNVGDLRPQEVPLSYFMELAYDFEAWGTDHPNRTEEFLTKWVEEQFGGAIADDTVKKEIHEILVSYARMHGDSKPEATNPKTYHATHYNEAKRKIKEFTKLSDKAEKLKEKIPAEAMDAFFSTVYFPAVAGANLQLANLYATLNQWYARMSAPVAKKYRALVDECMKKDEELTSYYHHTMADGKWNGMMLSRHFCFETWNEEGSHAPVTIDVESVEKEILYIHPEQQDRPVLTGKAALPEFTDLDKKTASIELICGGKVPVDYTVTTSEGWITLSETSGIVSDVNTVEVSIDWSKLTDSAVGIVQVVGAESNVSIQVTATILSNEEIPSGAGYIKDGVACMEAVHFNKKEAYEGHEWKTLDKYGKSLGSMKMYPTTENFEEPGKAPSMTYSVWVDKEAEYTLQAICAPTNNLENGRRMRYAVSVDGEEAKTADTLEEGFFVGAGNWGTPWAKGVLKNCHTGETTHALKRGLHKITVYGMDAGLVLQKLVLYRDKLPESYFGPEESVK